MTRQLLPAGMQDFSDMRRNNYVYVDKTEIIYQLITTGKPYFLSRPRRFGKSVLISTLEALYCGKRELFNNLWIDSSDWDWAKYPVIKLDMADFSNRSAEILEAELKLHLFSIAKHYDVALDDAPTAKSLLGTLIVLLHEKYQQQVVVLVDEYDKPLLDRIKNPEICYQNRDVLREVYETLKVKDKHIKLIFITGVTKFAKVSIFSGLNNLVDLSMTSQASALLGYTRTELETNFAEYIKEIADISNQPLDDCYQKIKHWYNGYQFSAEGQQVYNPFSVLLLLKQRTFKAYWFETGAPTFLLELIKKEQYEIKDVDLNTIDSTTFSSFDVDRIRCLPLLYQTGYLTIKAVDNRERYQLGYPNFEVEYSFLKVLLINYAEVDQDIQDTMLGKLEDALLAKEFDTFFMLLKQYFAMLPYDLHIKQERFYHAILYFLLTLVGLRIGAEVKTNRGRIDVLIEFPDVIYVTELKLNQSAEIAVNQIKENGYTDGLVAKNKAIYLMGINFDTKTRSINDCKVEKLT